MGTNKTPVRKTAKRKVRPPEMYTYCFVRKDIPMFAQLVQLGHACLQRPAPDQVNNLILFEVKNEDHLVQTKAYLESRGIDAYMFYEPDYDMGYTAIATEPIEGEDRKMFAKFNLWR